VRFLSSRPDIVPIRDFLARARATEPFRDALLTFLKEGRPNDRIRFNRGSPPVKVERVLTQALAAHPELEIDAVEIEGRSGCEYFRGSLDIEAVGETVCIEFHWNCKWKAEQEGWTDAFGMPDQIRAARTFGYECFSEWTEIDPVRTETAA